MKGFIVLIVLILTPCRAFSCQGKMADPMAVRPLIYNPFSALDSKQVITISIQNTGKDHCAFELTIPDMYRPLQFLAGLRFTINTTSQKTAVFAAATPVLQPHQYFSVQLMLSLPRGQMATAGTLFKTIGFSLKPANTNLPPVDAIQFSLRCIIPQQFQINLAGAGTRTSFEFNELQSHRRRSLVMQTRATQSHRLEIAPSSPHLIREGEPSGEASTIPFVWTLPADICSCHRCRTLSSRSCGRNKSSFDCYDRRYSQQACWKVQSCYQNSHHV